MKLFLFVFTIVVTFGATTTELAEVDMNSANEDEIAIVLDNPETDEPDDHEAVTAERGPEVFHHHGGWAR